MTTFCFFLLLLWLFVLAPPPPALFDSILSFLTFVSISSFPLHGCRLTCPNSLLFRVRSHRSHSPLWSSLSALSLCLSVPNNNSASHLPHSVTSTLTYILIPLLFSSSFLCLFYHMSNFSLSLSASLSPFFLLMRVQTDSCCLCGLHCELHVPSCERALPEDGASATDTISSNNFSKALLNPQKNHLAPVRGSARFFRLRPPSF